MSRSSAISPKDCPGPRGGSRGPHGDEEQGRGPQQHPPTEISGQLAALRQHESDERSEQAAGRQPPGLPADGAPDRDG